MKKILAICILSLPMLTQAQITDYFGAGNTEGVTVTASSSLADAPAMNTINGEGMDNKYFEAGRFLAQASMGMTVEQVDELAETLDFEGWIDNEFNKPLTLLLPLMETNWDNYLAQVAAAGFDPEFEFGPWNLHFSHAWWETNMENDDYLRQRMAYALGQIVVISNNSDLRDWGDALSSYYDMLQRNAFGNYRDILEEVTLHPAMGFYLSHFNNPKTDVQAQIRPDENYAREIMQLFSIGLYELNMDGTRKKNAQGEDIPTYSNTDIKEFAKIFTGLGAGGLEDWVNWTTTPYFGLNIYATDKAVPMIMYDDHHEPGAKNLLNGFTVPAGQTGMQDLQMTLDHLFNHPNVAPFISNLLIKRLVKSNPTPAYVERVAQAFADNGQGVRGDMQAVIKAILLDEEARSGTYMFEQHASRLREPFVKYLHAAKMVKMKPTSNGYWNNPYGFFEWNGQGLLMSPTVFNYFLPNHQPIGAITAAGLTAPEFKLHNTSTAINYVNSVHEWTIWDYFGNDWIRDDLNDESLEADVTYWEPLFNEPELFINEMDKYFTHGQMSDETRENLNTAITNLNWSWNNEWQWYRIRMGLYFTLISPDYNIIK